MRDIYEAISSRGYDAGLLMGLFFILAGTGLLAQLRYSSNRGFVYGYGSTRIYKDDNPTGYRLRTVIHIILAAFSVVGGIAFVALTRPA